MHTVDKSYVQGFIDKCAELDIDPEDLVKRASESRKDREASNEEESDSEKVQ